MDSLLKSRMIYRLYSIQPVFYYPYYHCPLIITHFDMNYVRMPCSSHSIQPSGHAVSTPAKGLHGHINKFSLLILWSWIHSSINRILSINTGQTCVISSNTISTIFLIFFSHLDSYFFVSLSAYSVRSLAYLFRDKLPTLFDYYYKWNIVLSLCMSVPCRLKITIGKWNSKIRSD